MYRFILQYIIVSREYGFRPYFYALTFCNRISLENYKQDNTVAFYQYDLTAEEIGQLLGGN